MRLIDKNTLSASDLTRARRELRGLLVRRRLSLRWIEDNVDELLSRAASEYAAKCAQGVEVYSPVGWIVNCAWWRAKDLLIQEGRRVEMRTLEAVRELPDEQIPEPEDVALGRDSDARVEKLFAELPERDRLLLSLIYLRDHSVREAAEKVGMPQKTANRHHNAFLTRMRERLADGRSLPSIAGAGLLAWRGLAAARHRLGELWRRVGGTVADPSGPVAAGGGGRALGACGAVAATLICGTATGVLPALHPGASSPPHTRPANARPDNERRAAQGAATPVPTAPPSTAPSASVRSAGRHDAKKPKRALARGDGTSLTASARTDSSQSTTEFGVEQGQSSVTQTSAAPAPASSASRVSSATAASPAPAASAPGSAARAGTKSGDSEFGF